jgi:tetratricopeptide (TPR) repeat protein
MWAGVALEIGELELAGPAWEAVLEIEPDHAYANKGLGVVRVLEDNFGHALPYLEKALEIDPQNVRTKYYLGLALIALGRPEEARTEFEKILELNNDRSVIDLASNQLLLIEP